ncbi:hypothetical protein ACNQVK_00310 [Mycobacterium sp. 134]
MKMVVERLGRKGWQIGPVAFGIESGRITASVSIPIRIPVIWRPRPAFLAPAPELDLEAFERAARKRAASGGEK